MTKDIIWIDELIEEARQRVMEFEAAEGEWNREIVERTAAKRVLAGLIEERERLTKKGDNG